MPQTVSWHQEWCQYENQTNISNSWNTYKTVPKVHEIHMKRRSPLPAAGRLRRQPRGVAAVLGHRRRSSGARVARSVLTNPARRFSPPADRRPALRRDGAPVWLEILSSCVHATRPFARGHAMATATQRKPADIVAAHRGLQSADQEDVWELLRVEADRKAREEPILGSYFHGDHPDHGSFGAALSFRLASKLDNPMLPTMLIRDVIEEAISDDPAILDAAEDRHPRQLRPGPGLRRLVHPLPLLQGVPRAAGPSHRALAVGAGAAHLGAVSSRARSAWDWAWISTRPHASAAA